MKTANARLIPTEVLQAYYPGGIAHQTLIEGGEINSTWLITEPNDAKTILQRLSHIYGESLAEDYAVVSAHLRQAGWEMAAVVAPNADTIYLRDLAGRLWRVYVYLESQPGSAQQGNWPASVALAGLLGKLHRSLATLKYEPRFTPAHANDTTRHANRLQEIMPQLKNSAQRKLAQTLITASHEPNIDATPLQLIHGDPRVGNVLFRNSQPFTFIDWDGLKVANPLVDVGDMLQSTLNELPPEALAAFSLSQLDPVLHAYYQTAGLAASEEIFRRAALEAGQLIALDLGIRQLIDTVEDHFFSPPNQFESRYDFNIRRAHEQLRVYQALRP